MTIGVIPPSGLDALTVKLSEETASVFGWSVLNANVDRGLKTLGGLARCGYDSAKGYVNKGFIIDSEVPSTVTVPVGVEFVKAYIAKYLGPSGSGSLTLNGEVVTSISNGAIGNSGSTSSNMQIFPVVAGDTISSNCTTMVIEEVLI